MKKLTKNLLILSSLLLLFSSNVYAGYSNWYSLSNTEIGTASSWLAVVFPQNFTEEGNNANTVRWNINEDSAYYKRVLSVLLMGHAAGKQIRWWNCGFDSSNQYFKACDIQIK